MRACPHTANVVTVATRRGSLRVCLDDKKVRSPGGAWRDRVKDDGIDSGWIEQMRRSLGLSPGPSSPPELRR